MLFASIVVVTGAAGCSEGRPSDRSESHHGWFGWMRSEKKEDSAAKYRSSVPDYGSLYNRPEYRDQIQDRRTRRDYDRTMAELEQVNRDAGRTH
jgi:hypothetical protein